MFIFAFCYVLFLWLTYFYSLCLSGLQLRVYQFGTSTFKETMKMFLQALGHLWQQSKVSWLLREHTHKHFQSPTLSVTDSYFFNNCCLATHLHSVIIFAWNVCGKQRGRGVQRRGKTKGLMKRKSEVIECNNEWVDVKRWAWDKVTCSPNLSLSKTKCSLTGQPHPFLTFRTCSPIIHQPPDLEIGFANQFVIITALKCQHTKGWLSVALGQRRSKWNG